MKKTKIVAALAAMALAFTLFSCANSSDSDGGNSSTPDNGGEENKLPEGVIEFGMWPQSKKAENVQINTEILEPNYLFSYSPGNDGNQYTEVSAGEWYKLEPIQWKCITEDYMGSGKKLYLSVNILERLAFYDGREREDLDIANNDYRNSKIRAYLIGEKYFYKNTETTSELEFYECGFLQTAFTAKEKEKLRAIEVEDNCQDKVFLLSLEDCENPEFFNNNNARLAERTDYTKDSDTSCVYWTRTAYPESKIHAFYIDASGTPNAGTVESSGNTGNTDYGVRPAILLD